LKKQKLLLLFLLVTIAYALIVLLGPTAPSTLAKYRLSQAKTHLLSLTVVVPFVLIWLSAFYGYVTFKKYAVLVRDTDEGPALTSISRGLGFLAFSLPVNSLISSFMGLLVIEHPSYLATTTIIRNYSAFILPLLAFITISRGAEMLVKLIKRRKKENLFHPSLWALGTIIVTSLFSWLIIVRPADTREAINVYQLPNWLIITTIVVPYLYIWFRGTLAAFYIISYQRNVTGKLYRQSLAYLSAGVFTVILINILVALITTLSTRLYRLHLTPILIIVYILVALYAVGFGLLASGAKKLKRIEEV